MTDADILDSRYSWTRLAISLVIAAVGSAGMWSIVLVMPGVQAEFGLERADASLPYTVFMIAFAFGNFVVGRVVDRFGVTSALIGSAILIGGSMALVAVSPTATAVIALHAVIGLGTAVTFGPLMADVSLWFMRRLGIAVAVTASGNYVAGAFWPLVLTGVLASDGWRAVYMLLAILVPCLMIPLSLLLRRRVPDGALRHSDTLSGQRAGASGISPRMLQYMLAVAGMGCCIAMAMPQVHIVSLCVDMGFGAVAGGQMLSLMLFGGVISRLFFGMVADRLGGVRTVLISAGLQCAALFLYLPAGGLVSLYTVSLVFGLSQGGIVPSYTLVVREYMPSREAGRRVGFVMMSTVGGMAIGGWMSGWIYDMTGSYQAAFLNGIAFNFLNIAIMVTILLRTRKRKEPQAVAA
ncbi:MFS transporter [Roseovarius pelagicus]|uniref:MFS transporter n=1 Tax=Roseovarius pelagicus TaxID=2980108 RepID=A0ABY6D784_9RHOB|nr:MFS transporter [Roseovarius pelagicus]UXX82002.1 MFS transporter [Roseovarius pelagicus]